MEKTCLMESDKIIIAHYPGYANRKIQHKKSPPEESGGDLSD